MLELKNIFKVHYTPRRPPTECIRDLSLQVTEREFVAVIGPSGCGKTTLLRLIAGLEKPTTGMVLFEQKTITGAHHERGLVFQDFALFPWLTVAENIAFGLNMRARTETAVNELVEHYLAITKLSEFKHSYPHTLSGGMQQRVAIARTLANNPKLLLLDEPFAALDYGTKSAMQEFLAELNNQHKATTIFVTHDIEEAIFLADRIVLLSGRPSIVEQEYLVPFGPVREPEIRFSEEFVKLKKMIYQKLNST